MTWYIITALLLIFVTFFQSGTVNNSSLHCAIISFSVLCITIVMAAIAAMITFYFLVHLGWTILSNNFVLVVAMLCAGLIKDRMDKSVASIRIDQHKAVLHEAALLLKEDQSALKGKDDDERYFGKAEVFSKSLESTDMFNLPGYIDIHDKYKQDLDMRTTMELQAS